MNNNTTFCVVCKTSKINESDNICADCLIQIKDLEESVKKAGYTTWPIIHEELRVSYASVIRKLDYMVKKKILLPPDKNGKYFPAIKTNIKLSDIKVKFGGKNPPKDKKCIELFMKAHQGQIPAYWGMIDIEGIKPFSNYRPETSQAFIDNIHQKLKSGDLPSLYVYPENKLFIMSDDYNLYYIYLYSGYKKLPCFILGEPTGKYISDLTGPIKLPKLEAEVI